MIKNRSLKIIVLGNSVSLIIRPPDKNASPYPILIERHFDNAFMVTKNDQAGIVTDALDNLYRWIVSFWPDIIIIHYGINEACSRLLPHFLHQYLFKERRSEISKPILRKFISALIYKISPFLIQFFRSGSWMSPENYGILLDRLISLTNKECAANIIVLNIPNITERIEKLLPGSIKNIREYNKIIENVCTSKKVYLVDLYSLSNEIGTELFVPDGIHLSSLGHEKLAEMINDYITNKISYKKKHSDRH